ncbi:MAG: transcriptional regulator GcvA [Pseudomonadota bacterium]
MEHVVRQLPSLNALKAFEASARHQSFTKAAEELLVTQSAVSRQVRALEDYLGASLFLRHPHHLELTTHGKTLSPVLTHMLDKLASVTAELRRTVNHLRVKLPPTFALRWLIPRLDDFQECYPDIEVLVNTGWNPVDFSREEFHVAVVCSRDLHLFDDTISIEEIATERVTPVCAPSLMNGKYRLQEPGDCFHHTLLHGSNLFDAWEIWFDSVGLKAPPELRAQTFDLMDSAINAAARGFGIALAPPQLILEDLKSSRLVAPFPRIMTILSGFYLVCPKKYIDLEAVQSFRNWLIQSTNKEWNAIGDHVDELGLNEARSFQFN